MTEPTVSAGPAATYVPPATAVRAGWQAWHTVVFLCCAAVFISYIDRTNISVASIAMKEQFGFSSIMQTPRIQKITLNMGVGDAKQDSNVLDAASEQLATLAGQAPSVRRARKSIAAFKLRDGMPVGVSVTLRRARMWEFLDRLTAIAIPRIRDFRGLNARSFDGRGNYSMGVREQIIFPEIDYDAIDQVRGLDVTITTTAKTDEEAYVLLRELGMPFNPEGAPGTADAESEVDAEEEARLEEARQKAEAEQAAFEQLKEENPEAYEAPTRSDEEDEEGEGGDAAPAEENQADLKRESRREKSLADAPASQKAPSAPLGTGHGRREESRVKWTEFERASETPVETITRDGEATDIRTKGRHDPCVGIRGVPVVEAMVALVLADQKLLHRAQNG